MKKIFCLVGLSLCLFATNSAFAGSGDVSQTGGAGTAVTIEVTAAGVPGASNIVFTPSSNVLMQGQSVATSWALDAVHSQALGKDNGQAYGMAADSNKMYFLDAKTITTLADISATNRTGAFGASWHTL
jgi:hypothetical protein